MLCSLNDSVIPISCKNKQILNRHRETERKPEQRYKNKENCYHRMTFIFHIFSFIPLTFLHMLCDLCGSLFLCLSVGPVSCRFDYELTWQCLEEFPDQYHLSYLLHLTPWNQSIQPFNLLNIQPFKHSGFTSSPPAASAFQVVRLSTVKGGPDL